ncbi:phosphatase domain-containing protein [Psychroflexus tropicus]|uniref:phosphatase domain-containing protein n=1 Tax=Psychroflexus tropicus TaxID=197345 RepID=UPI00039A111E|nr:phosphatase domain-containing protein [Psychroflexus tropicus]
MAFLWHFTALELNDKVLVTGTTLKNETRIDKYPKSIFGNAWNVLSSYRKKAYKNKTITIETDDQTYTVKTSKKGYFFKLLPEKTIEDFTVFDSDHQELPVNQYHPHYFKKSESPVEVISDIDDTVIHSHTASALKRIFSILFKRPKKRKKVLFTNALLDFFNESKYRIFYLSKSESNLFGLITAIFRYNEVPVGPLFLTPYQRFKTLFKPKKGKHKLNFLNCIISNQHDKKFILIGDDTQKDMDIYTEIANLYKSQILKIYIRQTSFFMSQVQKEKWQTLKSTGIDCMYFQDGDDYDVEVQNLIENYKEIK